MPEHLDCIGTGNGRYTVHLGHMADLQLACPLDLTVQVFVCGSTADRRRARPWIDLADLLHACCILRIHCRPVRSCGTTVLQVFVCGSTADRRWARRSIQLIHCGPVEFSGSTVGLLDFARGSTEFVQDSFKVIRNTVQFGSAGLSKLLSDWLNRGMQSITYKQWAREEQ